MNLSLHVAVLLFWMVGASANGSSVSTVEIKSTEFVNQLAQARSLSQIPFNEYVRDLYTKKFLGLAAKPLSDLSETELLAFWRAVYEAAFLTTDVEYINSMRDLRLELGRRGEFPEDMIQKELEVLLFAREWDRARALTTPETEAMVPEILESAAELNGSRPLWLVGPRGNTLEKGDIELSKGLLVIVVSHPKCAFSLAAMHAIGTDRVLSDFFSGHARWVAPAQAPVDVSYLRDWNTLNPRFSHALIDRIYQWPEVPFWDTPSFYFFADGVLVKELHGWPNDEMLGVLRAAVNELGPSR